MAETIRTDICVIGGGSGGLTVAAGASQMGASVVLIESGTMGGDCLNYGCVPSKALIAAAHAAEAARQAGRFGIGPNEPEIDAAGVFAHVRRAIEAIAPNDSVERFEALGVRVIRERARFVAGDMVAAGDFRVHAKRFVVATGSAPVVPDLPGLDALAPLTNETVFELGAIPGRLVVLGGGPIGIEMSQAFRRLGAGVDVLDRGPVLPRDDPEMVDVVRRRLRAEGVNLHEGVVVSRFEKTDGGFDAVIERNGAEERIAGTHLLAAAGRRPVTEGLDLAKAGIETGPRGIAVDARLRTTNRRVFAIGDVAGGPQFTHVAGYHAGVVIRNALFRLPAKVDYSALPWVTYTDPELANVGMTEAAAREKGIAFNVLRWGFSENDRAQAEDDIDGFTKVIVTPKGRVLGAGVVGAHAGETVQSWIVAIAGGLGIGRLAGAVVPYPTRGEIVKRAAGSFYTAKLFGDRTRSLVRLLLKLP